MREIVNSTYLTLDGIVENPATWGDAHWKEDGGERLSDTAAARRNLAGRTP